MWKLYKSYEWNELEDAFDWIRDMKTVPQNSEYHGEGNVDIHTRMVVEELFNLSEFKELGEQEQHILAAAAIMHDIEKRSSTKEETDGRLTTNGHAKKGEHSVREILYKYMETPFLVRETIAKLVKYHGLPLWVFEKENPEKALIKASLEVNTKLLYILAMADVKGRICHDKADLLERTELFKEFCIEQNCWDKPRYFETKDSRFQYFYNDISLNYIPFEKESFDVIVMSALPGSGKDWHIQKNYPSLPVISLDELRRKYKAKATDQKLTGRIVQECKEMAKAYLRKKQSFIWNATNLSSSIRKSLIDLFASYGARVKIIYIEVQYAKLVEQNRNRNFPIPVDVLDKMISKWEIPQLWEAHSIEYLVNRTNVSSFSKE